MFVQKKRKKHTKFRVIFYIFFALLSTGYIYLWQQFVNSAYQEQQNNLSIVLDIFDTNTPVLVKEAKKKAPVYINLPEAKQIRAIVEDYTQPDSLWTYVSKNSSILTSYTPSDLVIPNVAIRSGKSDSERSVRKVAAQPLEKLFKGAEQAGYRLIVGSAYRSASLQQAILNSAIASVGLEAANFGIALPGQSEHQTGLAVDISSASLECYIDSCFSGTDDGQWLAKNSYKYGFIVRYPSGKENITGYQYEPWHFRYVGIDLATALYESGLTLDEAWSYILKAHDTLKGNEAI
jgi:D-alanyl-D-alanine carboxypeptidase